ncbi:bacteriohopanetetrol glucosamine biosynthesis glycosyltransferase HpnI [Dyella halodurans]|uniref:Bacteriohopanetetrol glucosamine biosynthesis glycosyltransferase HpnI n=2 Tax=Dyella halodurans TaxID=1920171 RepID=A0ABV9C2V5_9GAMM|nr:bacteriohopanetetrol glucosamine biosynthesis glycosyltransferase HpnI [Dyella halodurans]
MLLLWIGTGLNLAAAAYACVSLWAWFRCRHAQAGRPAGRAIHPVSVFKPLHGAEPRLYENLRSFCLQDHANYQLLLGVREADDPAIAVVERLIAEFPALPIRLVVDPRIHGANLKVSNLINLRPHAQHDWLVLADSDISVSVDYLSRVTAPLADADVGIVTCLYHGVAEGGFWSRLGCLFIDDWFAPSARLAHAFGSTRFAFGSTIALRRETLDAIGGFEILCDTLADDFWLGELSRRAGLRTVLSDLVVGTEVSETSFHALWTHELRWLRTIRAIAPAGFAMTFVCFTWPVLVLGLVLAPTPPNALLALLGGGARVVRYVAQRRGTARTSPWHDLGLTPYRDLLLLFEWAMALTRWRVEWRGRVLHARKHAPTRYS